MKNRSYNNNSFLLKKYFFILDTVRHIIFGNEENREWTLSLYNAINGTTYDKSEDMELNTIWERCTQGESLEEAIDHTISMVPGDYILKSFLESHRAEVKGMLLTEYNEAETMEIVRESSRKEGAIETLIGLVKDGLLPLKDAAERAGVSVEDFRTKMKDIQRDVHR